MDQTSGATMFSATVVPESGLDRLSSILGVLSDIVWGPFVLIPLLLLTGLYLTARLKVLQIRTLPHALWLAFFRRTEKGAEGDISHYQALSTSLAATVGVGNIAGVATAIGIGGPGALFWMWVTGLLGMATKYSEALLGVKYRERDARGQQVGGPMFYLTNGVGGAFGLLLGTLFALFGAIAAFGIGNGVQSHEVAGVVERTWGVDTWITGAVLVVLVGVVIIGGIKSIGRVTAGIVPVMCIAYVFAGIAILIIFVGDLPDAIALVFSAAFTGESAVGGLFGSALLLTIQMGMARGMFSNEAGLGSGAISAAAAKTDQPVRQALVQMTQTFIDTIIVVSITGLVLVVTGAYNATDADGLDGAVLTSWAFEQGVGGTGTLIVAVGVVLFAYTTMLGWSYYGERCLVYLVERLFGVRDEIVTNVVVYAYRVLFAGLLFVGAVVEADLVWTFSDIANGLMALPNLLGLLLLSGVVARETSKYMGIPNWKDPNAHVITDVRGNGGWRPAD
uniref:alanine/glycine:cation symporter family protein n=1 Tax=Spiractinospora alimapuensis TaxID=2820884 RepID=UPI001F16E53B|nr:amino acid carrier protein [Spiractinospora alimapuensis]